MGKFQTAIKPAFISWYFAIQHRSKAMVSISLVWLHLALFRNVVWTYYWSHLVWIMEFNDNDIQICMRLIKWVWTHTYLYEQEIALRIEFILRICDIFRCKMIRLAWHAEKWSSQKQLASTPTFRSTYSLAHANRATYPELNHRKLMVLVTTSASLQCSHMHSLTDSWAFSISLLPNRLFLSNVG